MSSETINELVETLGALESRLKEFDTEARKLSELRGEMKAAASGLHSVGKDLRDVASGLREGASTMRDLDMAATLRRLAEIEATLDARSQQLEKAIDREIAELGESLKHQVSKQLDQLPGQLGPTVAAAFDKQFETTKAAIDALVADARARHAEILMTIRQTIETEAMQAKSRDEALGQSVLQLGAAIRDTHEREVATLTKALAEADSRSAGRAKEVEAAVLEGTSRATRIAALAATLAAGALVAGVICIFV
jgi:hypothetical protein